MGKKKQAANTKEKSNAQQKRNGQQQKRNVQQQKRNGQQQWSNVQQVTLQLPIPNLDDTRRRLEDAGDIDASRHNTYDSGRQLAKLDDIRNQLRSLDESNITELIALKWNMERYLSTSDSYIPPVVAASTLTRDQVYSAFELENDLLQDGWINHPPFVRPTETSQSTSEWLADALNRTSDMLLPVIRINLNQLTILMIMEVFHELPNPNPCTSFHAGIKRDSSRTDSPQPATNTPPSLNIFNRKIRYHATVNIEGKEIKVVSRFDTVFTMSKHSYIEHGVFIDPYFAILEITGTERDFRAAANEVIVSMTIHHHTRRELLERLWLEDDSYIAYAVLTSGPLYQFFFLDETMLVHVSEILDCVGTRPDVLQYLRFCFQEVHISNPRYFPLTSAPDSEQD